MVLKSSLKAGFDTGSDYDQDHDGNDGEDYGG